MLLFENRDAYRSGSYHCHLGDTPVDKPLPKAEAQVRVDMDYFNRIAAHAGYCSLCSKLLGFDCSCFAQIRARQVTPPPGI